MVVYIYISNVVRISFDITILSNTRTSLIRIPLSTPRFTQFTRISLDRNSHCHTHVTRIRCTSLDVVLYEACLSFVSLSTSLLRLDLHITRSYSLNITRSYSLNITLHSIHENVTRSYLTTMMILDVEECSGWDTVLVGATATAMYVCFRSTLLLFSLYSIFTLFLFSLYFKHYYTAFFLLFFRRTKSEFDSAVKSES